MSPRPSRRNRPSEAGPSRPPQANGRTVAESDQRPASRLPLLAIVVGLAIVIAVMVLWAKRNADGPSAPPRPALVGIPARYNADRAMGYLRQLCDLGPRPSHSAAMRRQQAMLQDFFTERGAAVSMQRFEIRHPETGATVPLANLIATWYPDRPRRFLLCAHYDTRPFPDRDPVDPRGVFVGANDGASGTAALMELSNQFADLPDDVGVDIVLFDGEEFVFQQGRDDYFLGSTFFAEKYKRDPPTVPYRAGILLDMVGDRELRIFYEQHSLQYAREVAREVFTVAKRLQVNAFVARARHRIEDDHLPLNRIAQIPTIDLIDFDYPRPGIGAPRYWHTTKDIPENCSGLSLAAVVWVVDQWLKTTKR